MAFDLRQVQSALSSTCNSIHRGYENITHSNNKLTNAAVKSALCAVAAGVIALALGASGFGTIVIMATVGITAFALSCQSEGESFAGRTIGSLRAGGWLK